MTKKQLSMQWHEDNRLFVYFYFNGYCQRCHLFFPYNDAISFKHSNLLTRTCVIHHLSYPPGCYTTPAMFLLKKGIITLLCKHCHKCVHIDKHPQFFHSKALSEYVYDITKPSSSLVYLMHAELSILHFNHE